MSASARTPGTVEPGPAGNGPAQPEPVQPGAAGSDAAVGRLPMLLEAGATVALGADDPLLFGSRLASQYATMRAAHDLSDDVLAELARMSLRASRAPDDVRKEALADIDAWLASDPDAGD